MSHPNVKQMLVEILDLYEKEITNFVKILSNTARSGKNIWLAGNGGSASTAEHFEIDLLKIKSPEVPYALSVNSLTSNTAVLTAIANDLGSEYLFSRQLERKSREGDALFLISASGNSPNLIRAYEFCSFRGINCLALLGFDGGFLGKAMKHKLVIHSNVGDYALVENLHLMICHEIAIRFYDSLLEI